MIKLTKEDIQFIETYLENSDVAYADIRVEMTDHIASEIEQLMVSDKRGFYDIFKAYMIANKARLLINNKQYVKAADTSIIRKLCLEFPRLSTVLIFSATFLISFKYISYIEVDTLRDYLGALPFLSIVPFCVVYVIAINVFKLPRFSGIERLAFLYLICFQLFNFLSSFSRFYVQNESNFLIVAIVISIIVTLSVLILKISLKTINQYRKNFKYNYEIK